MNSSYRQMKDEDGRHIVIVDAFNVAEKRIQKLKNKLIEADIDKKSAEVALQGVERQAKNQHKQLRQTKDHLTIAKEQIGVLKKRLEEAKKAIEKVE